MSTILFETTLSDADDEQAFLTLPKGTSGIRSSSTVEGTVNGFPFRTRLEAHRRIPLSTGMCGGAGIEPGDACRVEITRVDDEAETRLPAELEKALADASEARQTWDDITPLARRDWILWITTAKKPETRLIRVEKTCSKLASGMRRVCCFPGLKWLTRDHVAPEETWASLP